MRWRCDEEDEGPFLEATPLLLMLRLLFLCTTVEAEGEEDRADRLGLDLLRCAGRRWPGLRLEDSGFLLPVLGEFLAPEEDVLMAAAEEEEVVVEPLAVILWCWVGAGLLLGVSTEVAWEESRGRDAE